MLIPSPFVFVAVCFFPPFIVGFVIFYLPLQSSKLAYTGHTQKNGAISKVIKNVFLILEEYNITVSSGNYPSFSCAY
jgi:hypothetical protein